MISTVEDVLASAACRGVDPDIMFPLGVEGSPGYARGLAQARAVCRGCPLLAPCARYALASGDDVSVLAGTTPGERRMLRAKARRSRGREAA